MSFRKTNINKAKQGLNYRNYLRSEHWQQVKDAIKLRDRCCQLCTSFLNLEVHHKTYKNKGNELENLGDLVLLCSNCHTKVHQDETHNLNPKNN